MRTYEKNGGLCKAYMICYTNTLDNNSILGVIDYYSVLREVIDLQYFEGLCVVLFKCDWYRVLSSTNGVRVNAYSFVCINTTNNLQTDEPFRMASEARQVFYLTNHFDENWSTVLVVVVGKQFVLCGEMSGTSSETYKELGIGIASHGESILVDEDLQWNREDIQRDEVEVDLTLRVLSQINQATYEHAIETDTLDEDIEIDILDEVDIFSSESESVVEDDF